MQPGEYETLLWIDYTPIGSTADYYYTTTSLKGVIFNTDIPYTACTPSRDALYLSFPITVSEEPVTEADITLKRPFAKYSILSTDLEDYQTDIEINQKPPIDELTITVSYHGYFPNSLNIATGKINNSTNGIKYQTTLGEVTATEASICNDYVFVTGLESSVNATIVITDTRGKKIAEIQRIKIKYRQDHLTTVSGEFLTAGIASDGITIDTDWDGSYNVIF